MTKYYLNNKPALYSKSSIKSNKPYYYCIFLAVLINSFNQFSFTSNNYFSLAVRNGINIYNIGSTI